jgi:hypothetical protein
VWGYDDAFIEACRAELVLSPDDLTSTSLQVAEDDSGVIGVAQVCLEGREQSCHPRR